MTFDRTDGFYRRWIIIDFPNQFKDGYEITDEIKEEELENFCLKLLYKLRSLLQKRKFTNDGDINHRKKRYEEKSNPLKTFIELNYKRDIEGVVVKWQFNESFKEFLNQRGYRLLTNFEINKGLQSMGFLIKKSRVEEKVWQVIEGMILRFKEPQKKVVE